MGWFFRKSFKAGPIRINLSKSGIGYSIGTKGFRIGEGPRGRYVRMGFGNIYYYDKIEDSSNNESSLNNNHNSSLQLTDEVQMNSFNTTMQLENVDLELFTDANKMGLAQLLNNQLRFCLNLEQQFYEQKNQIDAQRNAQIEKQNLLLAQESKKYWGIEAFVIGLIISIILCPLLLIFVPYSIIYYNYRKEKLQKKEQEIERKYRPFFNNLSQRENELVQKYWSVKASHQLKMNFDEKQVNFLESIRNLFSSLTQKGHLVLLYQTPSANCLIRNQYGIIRELSFGDAVLSNLLFDTRIPSIVVGSRSFLFFPQTLIIEENQQYYQVPYDNLKVLQYAERDVLKNQPNEGDFVVQELWEHARVDGTQDRRYKNNTCRYIIRYYGVTFINNKHLCIPFYFSNKESYNIFMSNLNNIISHR